MRIGFIDSGMGGLSILKISIDKVKGEYFYLADNLNCPYGKKSKSDIVKFMEKNVDILIERGCEVIVIACNTATMASIDYLRNKYKNVKIIGTEPAVKPAKKYIDKNGGSCLVLATSITLREERFLNHVNKLGFESNKINFIELDDLVKMIENEEVTDEEIVKYLNDKFKYIDPLDYKAVVLGCTHFPLINDIFKDIFKIAKLFDSSLGVTNYLKKNIKESDESRGIKVLLTTKDEKLKESIIKVIKGD